jgi:DNA end-binding protein Ku
MARAIWKGAISFGLVHIPVALQSAVSSQGINFDWLDERSMEPVGYKRVNKVSGKEVTKEHIVKGVEYEKGRYVILSEEEIRTAHPESTQTIDIFSFINRDQIPLVNIDTPYYLAPDKRGEKVYALLRQTLEETDKVALAYVVLHTRQHLCALMPVESAIVMVMLRWPSEVRGLASIELSKAATGPTLNKSEKEMAKRLVEDMAGEWEPDEYRDSFQEKIMALVDKKASHGEIKNVEQEEVEERRSADIIDLTELLKRSLGGAKAEPKNKSSPSTESKKSPSASKSSKPAASKSSATKSSTPKTKAASSRSKTTAAKSAAARPAAKAKKAGK